MQHWQHQILQRPQCRDLEQAMMRERITQSYTLLFTTPSRIKNLHQIPRHLCALTPPPSNSRNVCYNQQLISPREQKILNTAQNNRKKENLLRRIFRNTSTRILSLAFPFSI